MEHSYNSASLLLQFFDYLHNSPEVILISFQIFMHFLFDFCGKHKYNDGMEESGQGNGVAAMPQVIPQAPTDGAASDAAPASNAPETPSISAVDPAAVTTTGIEVRIENLL